MKYFDHTSWAVATLAFVILLKFTLSHKKSSLLSSTVIFDKFEKQKFHLLDYAFKSVSY